MIYHFFASEASEGSHYQLYNLDADPFESTNVASTDPARLREMMRELVAEVQRHNALYPLNEESGAPAEPIVA